MKVYLLIALLAALLVAGCVSPGQQKQPQQDQQDKGQQAPSPTAVVDEEQSFQEVENISSEIDEIASIEEELNISDLDQIDFELG